MSQALATRDQPSPANAGSLIPRSLPEAMRMAEIMANARMVPKHLQGDVGSCFMIVEQAQRWNMSPFLVAQCTSNIGGKLCYEGKLIAAAITSTGGIIGEFDYEFVGSQKEPKTLSVKVSALRASDRQRKEITLSWAEAKTENKYWVSQPEQQLTYAGARVWARRWTPGPMLGVSAPEEQGREFDVEAVAEEAAKELPAAPAEPVPPLAVTADDFLAHLLLDASEAAQQGLRYYQIFWKALSVAQQKALAPHHDELKRRGEEADQQWLATFRQRLDACHLQDEVNAVCDEPEVQKMGDWLKNGARKQFDEIIADSLDRVSGLDTRSAPMET